MEHYIGVDLHKAFFQACAVDAGGARCWEDRFPTTSDGVAAFIGRCEGARAVAVEASGPTWSFADHVAAHVPQICIVDPGRTRLKAGYVAKTDRLDARRLADALRRDRRSRFVNCASCAAIGAVWRACRSPLSNVSTPCSRARASRCRRRAICLVRRA